MTQQNRGDEAADMFVIDVSSSVPPFRQLHDAAVQAISDGRLLPGQRMPTIRALATRLGLAANTVAAAYRLLEESGVVEGRGRAGTFVSLGEDPLLASARKVAQSAVTRLRELGLSREDARIVLVEAAETAAE